MSLLSKKNDRAKSIDRFMSLYDDSGPLFSSSADELKKYASDLEAAYRDAEPYLNARQRAIIREMKDELLNEIKEEIRVLEEDQ